MSLKIIYALRVDSSTRTELVFSLVVLERLRRTTSSVVSLGSPLSTHVVVVISSGLLLKKISFPLMGR